MRLIEEQFAFVEDIGRLIAKAPELGFVLTFGEAWRPETQAWINSLPVNSALIAIAPDSTKREFGARVGGTGVLKSVHMSRIAVDFNIFKTLDFSKICTVDEARPLGEYWKFLSPRNRWGGDFKTPRPDAPHFERTLL